MRFLLAFSVLPSTAAASSYPNFWEHTTGSASFHHQGSDPFGSQNQPSQSDSSIDGDNKAASDRSLALIQSGPLGGQVGLTFFEASGGIHPYDVCNDGMEKSFILPNYFCSFQDESIPVVWPLPIMYQGAPPTNNTGTLVSCPDKSDMCSSMNLTSLGLQSCLELCEDRGGLGEPCSSKMDGSFESLDSCGSSLFCQRDAAAVLKDYGNTGICAFCPENPEDCLIDSVGGLTKASKHSCLECHKSCGYQYWGELTIDGEEGGEKIIAFGLSALSFPTQMGSVVAPLVDCSDLILDNVEICEGANNSVCLVDNFDVDTIFSDIVLECENSGGVALVIYDGKLPFAEIPLNGVLAAPASIPAIIIGSNAGKMLNEKKLGSLVNVTTHAAGSQCFVEAYCSTTVPCMQENKFCNFLAGEGQFCGDCPEDPVHCFFSTADSLLEGSLLEENSVKQCASNCAASLELGTNCKLCGESITSFEFGVDDPSDRCNFCPEEDLKYRERTIPMFSSATTDVTCAQVQSFFSKVDVHKDSKNCRLAQLQNYICGCQGPGYAGANTQAKREALVWMPRATAILSCLGSLFVLVDVLKTRARRSSLFHQLMAQMSIFDIVGSIAYAFTSLPIPSDYFYEGAKGTEATCTAQGFFIQVGTVACYTNVSLAFYYYFLIQKGWSDTRLKKVRYWFFICPILVGFAFAFAGIPFYDNMVLWCNNSASWWPDVAVAVAILLSTIVMGSICWDVYKKSKASRRWQQGGASSSDSLSTKVFWQSFWYLMAFYMTWPPYLALQYFWAAGKEYGNYGFILYAGSVVPLQGVWNFFVYARNRQLKRLGAAISRTGDMLRTSMITRYSASRFSRRSSGQDAVSATQKNDPAEGQNEQEGGAE